MMQQINMPGLLRENCVLQRGDHTRVWGWYEKDTEITVEFQQHRYVTITDAEGYFEVLADCVETGGPYILRVYSEDGQMTENREVYVGDVFVCSGQSNMELPVGRVREMFPDEAGSLNVHQYKVEECAEFEKPLKEHKSAKWTVCTGKNLEETTALGYFFGKMISQKENVPVGIINISKGGTPAEAWISEEGLKNYPEFLLEKQKFADSEYRAGFFTEQDIREEAWHENLRHLDKTAEDKEWKEILLPGYFQDQGLKDFCGLLYLKKTFEVPEHLAGKAGTLKLGTLVDSDRTYVNGKFVGETGYCFPPRIYKIPQGILKKGKNEIFIKLKCRDGKGRITENKPCDICFTSGEKISLRGKWQYQIRVVSEPAPILQFITRKPTGMYQGMVAPCLNMTVRSVLWYQGESNEGNPELYEDILKKMICDWRKHWRQEKLPFILIQLPVCNIDIRGGGAWAVIRQAQKQAQELPEVAMTVNLDLGEVNDLHPLNKETVAYRAYLAARHLLYKEEIIWQGPVLNEIQKKENEILLRFESGKEKQLLTTDDEAPGEFVASGENGIFYKVNAEIEGMNVRIYSTGEDGLKVNAMKKIRYAWSDAPVTGLLKNSQGLLTAPFCIDLP